MSEPFSWRQHMVSFTIPAAQLVPQYGWVRHPTRPHWRDYRRAIQGGITFAARLHLKTLQAKTDALSHLKADLFGAWLKHDG